MTLGSATSAHNGDTIERLGVVIGAMRAGTTSLYQLLGQTGLVCLSRIKEPDFFIAEKSAYRGARWYASLFAEPDKVCVDISPNYAKNDVFPGVAAAIRQFNPQARIVYVVREPVDRAVSDYFHQKAAGADMPPPDQLLASPQGRHILSTSSYDRQIADFYAAFPAEQILIVDMKTLVSDPNQELAKILTFLGASPASPLALDAVAANDRASLDRLPKAWLSLRRTRLGDLVRSLVPPAWHGRLKAMGSGLSPGASSAGPEPFPEPVRAAIRAELADDMARFRARVGAGRFGWL
ncbi:MAG: sulfotransferase [Caulobacteraceae bacterium]|nr:sulfotransferase [Caulobacteraceae bacterium]